ncbi:YiiX/YebB-like N1pC/P60 family cysteine hydrolase [Tissierella praeacuta]|uniref:YiiX/YebB-like N1pC/P60 family cysteine hydrolase n=1 Tax=Tissierella praeacuta TaxID=43131 RepID=UPI00333FBF1C
MFKRFMKSISAIVLALILLIPNASLAAERDKHLSAEQVFTEKELLRIEKEVEQKELEFDKLGERKGLSISAKLSGTYPRRKGAILVTKDKFKGIIPTGHAAIVYSHGTVVESLGEGVITGKNDWYETRKTCYGLTVKGTTISEDEQAANWCYRQIGKPYNWNYLNSSTRDKFYCSQLVYAAFLDNFGINLDTSDFGAAVHPMELVNSNNTSLLYEK